jgi:hypothetical protein
MALSAFLAYASRTDIAKLKVDRHGRLFAQTKRGDLLATYLVNTLCSLLDPEKVESANARVVADALAVAAKDLSRVASSLRNQFKGKAK